MIFPYPKFNEGKNAVTKGQQLIIPSICLAKNTDKFGNCYYYVLDNGSALTLIFSKFQINGLPDEIDEEKGAIPIEREDLKKLRRGVHTKDYREKALPDQKLVQYWNNNANDNVDLVIDTKINYEKPARRN